MKSMLKKNYGRILSLMLVMSMLFGFGGCSSLTQMLLQHKGEQEKQETTGGNEDGQNTTDNQKNHSVADIAMQDSEETDVMSDFFVEKVETLEDVIDWYYMGDVPVEDLRDEMYKGLLEGLGDPYSCYYTVDEYAAMMESTSGVYCGIGSVVQQNVNTMLITIVKPYVDGPAYKAGMLPGDIIYKVDDVDVTGMDINTVVAMMRGEEGTVVKVTVMRDGVADPIDLMITRAMIEVESVEHEMLDNKIGLITISSFDEPTAKQFKEAIEDLKADGMKGLIIDLRNNGGGLLDAVVEMLDYILPKGLIVYMEDKYGNREEFMGTDKDVLEMPIVVLINGNSASASEIFAAAMQDYDAAELVGTTSFGKGIVQSVIPFKDGTAVKLTTASYFTPKGVCIHGIGVTPDIEVDLNEELKQQVVIEHKDDNQLQKAIETLQKEIK